MRGGMEGGVEGAREGKGTGSSVNLHRADRRPGFVAPTASYWFACHPDTDPPRVPFTETTEY